MAVSALQWDHSEIKDSLGKYLCAKLCIDSGEAAVAQEM